MRRKCQFFSRASRIRNYFLNDQWHSIIIIIIIIIIITVIIIIKAILLLAKHEDEIISWIQLKVVFKSQLATF